MMAVFFSLEIAAQACAAFGSLLVVHNMDKQHYAWYALAYNLQGTLAIFTMMGIGTGLMSLGGQCIGDRTRMGSLAASALHQRRSLLAGAAPVALPIFGYLLIKNGCPVGNAVILLLLALAVLYVEFDRQVFSTSVRLWGRYNFLQRATLLEAILRVAVLGLLLLTGGLNAIMTMLVSVLVTAYVVRTMIGKAARTLADPDASPDPEIARQLTRMNWNVLPTTVASLFQSQIGMGMISLFGKTSSVADLGALTRISLVTAVPLALFSKVVEPKLARAQLGHDLWAKCLASLVLAVVLALGAFGFIVAFSHPILWLLGPNYSGLHRELLWFGAVSCGWIVAGLPEFVLYARGWVQYVWVAPVAEAVCQALALPFLDLAHPLGVLSLDALRGVIAFAVCGGLVIRQWLLWRSARKTQVAHSETLPVVTGERPV